MEASPSSTASRRRTFDLPKSSSDAGLAAWTSRIKAIQQEVDQDEEAEQRRLQEEIEKSRLERAKRRNTATGSIDWTKGTAGSALDGRSDNAEGFAGNEDHHSDALQKLSGSSAASSSSTSRVSPKLTTSGEPVSLAAFIGGRATGPRLNRHAPQADSHNSALYDQARPTGPHPIFGRPRAPSKGQLVETMKDDLDAMGSLSIDTVSPAKFIVKHVPDGPPSQSSKNTDIAQTSVVETPPNIRGQVDEQMNPKNSPPTIPRKPKFMCTLSENENETIISPLPVITQLTPATSQAQQAPSNIAQISTQTPKISQKPTSLAELISGRASGPRLNKPSAENFLDSSISSQSGAMGRGHALPGLTSSDRNGSPSIPNISYSQQNTKDTPIPSSKHGSSIVTQSLARPAQPKVVAQFSAITPTSSMPSPAFLRPSPSTEELHPSLTRLKGRGFVEQRVRATSQLSTVDSPESIERSVSPTSGSPGRRPTVLDRWQPSVASTTPLPSAAPQGKKPAGYRELPGLASGSFSPVVQSRGSQEQMRMGGDEGQKEAVAPVRLPGLAVMSSLPVKERVSVTTSVHDDTHSREKESMSTTPLSHPTRDRARKPPKKSTASKVSNDSSTKSDHIGTINIPPHASTSVVVDIPDNIQTEATPFPIKDGTSALKGMKQLKDALTLQVADPSTSPLSVEPRHNNSNRTEAVNHPVAEVRTPTSPDEAPPTPSRHSRIPSTGQRATVMDVAQALLQHEQHVRESSWTPEPENLEPEDESAVVEEMPRADVKGLIAGWGRNFTPSGVPERRRSSYDRFSIATLPPLVEVQTPAETPQASISRVSTQIDQQPIKVQEIHQSLQALTSLEESVVEQLTSEQASDEKSVVEESKPSQPTFNDNADIPSSFESGDSMVIIEYEDKLPPPFNLQTALKEVPFIPNVNSQTVSVEILLISGSMAMPVTKEPNVFYDGEVAAVVHRAKDKKGGLVSNNVWIWRGKNAKLGEKEERKAHELAERFGTMAVHVTQGSEPANLIHILGGVLAVRQGGRARWSVENTAMHRVHRVGDSIFVDEVDLGIWNLCSAYSYCVSILDALYVWHGLGSSEDERKVALTYAQSLGPTAGNVMEFEEGAEDEMFWLMLGEDGYANADYWKFRKQLDRLGPRLYAIDANKTKAPVQVLPSASAVDLAEDNVIVVDCRLEIFVLVTAHARGRRTDIQLGLFLAQNICATAAHKRPFDPPIHVVILPSKLPLELRAALRLCDEEKLNGGPIPDHMNVLSLSHAIDHMQRRSWPRSLLSDPNFLPLGVNPSMI